MERFLRNGVKHHFNNLCEKEIKIKNEQIILNDLGEHTYRINFDDSLNYEITEFLYTHRYLTNKDGDKIKFQLTLTDSLEFVAIRNKVHRYPLGLPDYNSPFSFRSMPNLRLNALAQIHENTTTLDDNETNIDLEDYRVLWPDENDRISGRELTALIKAYESINEWDEITDLHEREVLWSERNNTFKFSFGKPMMMDGGIIVLIDSITLEVIKMGRWPLKSNNPYNNFIKSTDMERVLRNGVKHHFYNLCEKEIEIKNDQINLYDLGEHTYRINFDDSLNCDMTNFLRKHCFLTYKEDDEIEFQVNLTESLDFFALRNKIHRYPLFIPNRKPPFIIHSIPKLYLHGIAEIFERNKAVNYKARYVLDDYSEFLSEEAFDITDLHLRALIKAYESIKKWEEDGEKIDLNERFALWSERNNHIQFEFSKPSYMGGKQIWIDSITLEVIERDK